MLNALIMTVSSRAELTKVSAPAEPSQCSWCLLSDALAPPGRAVSAQYVPCSGSFPCCKYRASAATGEQPSATANVGAAAHEDRRSLHRRLTYAFSRACHVHGTKVAPN